MLNRNKLEEVLSNLEGYAREYAKADAEKRQVKENAIEAVRHAHTNGLEVKEILDDMIVKTDDLEFTMKIMDECFYSAKDDLLRMVENIVMPKALDA